MTKLEKIRIEKGFSKYRLSKESGVSTGYIIMIEQGKRDIKDATYKKIKALADALGVDFMELIDWSFMKFFILFYVNILTY